MGVGGGGAPNILLLGMLGLGAVVLAGLIFVYANVFATAVDGIDRASSLSKPSAPPSPPWPPPPPPSPPPPPLVGRRRLLFDAENTTPTPWTPPLSPEPVPNATAIAETARAVAAAQVARMQRIDNKIAAARWAREHPSPAPTSRVAISAKKRAEVEARYDQAEGVEEARARAYDLVQGALAAEAAAKLTLAQTASAAISG